MTAAPLSPLGPYTLAEWHEAEQPSAGRLELLAGWWLVSPAPEFDHQLIADELRHALRDQIDGYAVTAVGIDVSTEHRDGLIPDVVVASRRPERGYVSADDVELVGEVWSPGNRIWERQAKRAVYASAGIPALWEVVLDGGVELRAQQLTGRSVCRS